MIQIRHYINLTPTQNSRSQQEKQPKLFFPNLDGLRFICFLLVFLFHCYKTVFESLRNSSGFDKAVFDGVKFLFQNGELGVNFFFVLSGFLITMLLIKEKSFTGTIHLRHFYIRRVLRIWPLFFLCIMIGFVVVPLLKSAVGQPTNEIANPTYYLFFVNNFDYINSWPSFPDALILIVLWSVAVEEQFYLLWPLLLKLFPTRYYPYLFVTILAFTLIFRSFYTGSTDHDYAIRHFHTFAVIGDMAIGALLAYYCSYQSKFLLWIIDLKKSYIGMIYVWLSFLLLFRHAIFSMPEVMVLERAVIASLFGFIIVEQNFAKYSFFKMCQFKMISRLGLYTYGMYCLHFFFMSIVNGGVDRIGLENSAWLSIIILLTSLAIVIFGSILVFNYFEKPFLKLKDRFSFISQN